MTTSRSRRHHLVSNFYLKGFANDRGHVIQTDLGDGSHHPVSTDDATVIRDFNTITLEDGERSDVVERHFSTIEGPASNALSDLLAGLWPIRGEQRHALASWMGLQMMRGSGVRSRQNELFAQMIRLMVGVSGREALRGLIEAAEELPISDEDLEAEWADLTQASGPNVIPDVLFHSQMIVQLLPLHRRMLIDGRWTLVRFERRALITSDHPVAFYPRPDLEPWESLALATAAGITVPLSRKIGLQIGFDRVPDMPEMVIPPTTVIAKDFNNQTMRNARRFLYHHPDDDILDGIELPAMRSGELMPVPDHFIRDEGIFAGVSEEGRHALSMDHIPQEARGQGMSLQDLGWPIQNRVGITRPSQRG